MKLFVKRFLAVLLTILLFTVVAASIFIVIAVKKDKPIPGLSNLNKQRVIQNLTTTPRADDNVGNSYPQKVDFGNVYFYKSVSTGDKVQSQLEGIILEIDKDDKSILVGNEESKQGTWVALKDGAYLSEGEDLRNGGKPGNRKPLSFNNLAIGDHVLCTGVEHGDGDIYVVGYMLRLIKP